MRNRRTAGGAPVRLNLETKVTPDSGATVIDPAGFVRLLVTVVQGARLAGRVTVQSFDWRTLVEVKRVAPDIATACLTIDSDGMNTVRADASGASPWHAGLRLADHGGSLPRLVKAAGCETWSPFWRNLTPALVAEAHGLGLKVLPWTVNEPADMERAHRGACRRHHHRLSGSPARRVACARHAVALTVDLRQSVAAKLCGTSSKACGIAADARVYCGFTGNAHATQSALT